MTKNTPVTQHQLEFEKKKLESVMEMINDGVLILDSKGIVLDVNRQAIK